MLEKTVAQTTIAKEVSLTGGRATHRSRSDHDF